MQALHCTFQIASRPGAAVFDLVLQVRQPLASLRLSIDPPDDAVLLAYFPGLNLSPRDCLQELQDSGSPRLSLPPDGIERRFANTSFTVSTPYFYLTDVFVTNAEGQRQPLYFCHRLPADAQAGSSVTLYNHRLEPVKDVSCLHWRTTTENLFFNNLKNHWDPYTGTGEVYYLSYIDAYDCQRWVLLDNEPAFRPLPVEDFDQWDTSQRYYRIRREKTLFVVEILFDALLYSPTPGLFSLWLPPEAFGQVFLSPTLRPEDPWLLNVREMQLFYPGYDRQPRFYTLPEFEEQYFAPHQPYRRLVRQPATICNSYLLSLPCQELILDAEQDLHLEIVVLNDKGQIRRAYHTDTDLTYCPDLNGQTSSIRYQHDFLAAVSRRDGFLHLKNPLNDDEQVLVSCHYRTHYFLEPQINYNPSYNPEILNTHQVLVCMPEMVSMLQGDIVCDYGTEAQENLRQLVEQLLGSRGVRQILQQPVSQIWEEVQFVCLDLKNTTPSNTDLLSFLDLGGILLTHRTHYESLKSAWNITTEDIAADFPHLRSFTHRRGLVIDYSLLLDFLTTDTIPARTRVFAPTCSAEITFTLVEFGWFSTGWFEADWFADYANDNGWFFTGWFEVGWFLSLDSAILPMCLPADSYGFAPHLFLPRLMASYSSHPGESYPYEPAEYQSAYLRQLRELVSQQLQQSLADLDAPHRLLRLQLDQDGIITSADHPYLSLEGLHYDDFLQRYTIAGANRWQFLVLHHGCLVLPITPAQLEWLDCRQRGGGLRPGTQLDRLLKRYPELGSCLDLWRLDGRPFPGGAALLVELPYTLLKDYGGSWRQEEIEREIQKFLGYGIYPVLRFYGAADPRLLSFSYANNTLTVTWEDTGGPYTIYWGDSLENLTAHLITTNPQVAIPWPAQQRHLILLVTPIQHNSRMLAQTYVVYTP